MHERTDVWLSHLGEGVALGCCQLLLILKQEYALEPWVGKISMESD